MHIVSANTTAEGAPVWWTGRGWSAEIAEAARLDAEAAQAALDRALRHDQRIVAVVEVEKLGADGGPRRRQRIRALGPTVRPDLGSDPIRVPVAA
jgi:hypothetical protein